MPDLVEFYEALLSKQSRVRRGNNFLRKCSAAIDIFESCSSMVSIFRKRRNVIFEKYVS